MSLTVFSQCIFVFLIVSISNQSATASVDALESYVKQENPSSWTIRSRETSADFTVISVDLVSQQWRGHEWKHEMLIVRPKLIRKADIGFLLVTGSENASSHLDTLRLLAERAGAVATVISSVPNQPLYEGRVEDALMAYTFDQFAKTGDATWPIIFPMVKSALCGLDTVQAVSRKEFGQEIKRFVMAGASKRGWTTWLAAAKDARIVGIAPMVFDMLNMTAQTAWAQKVYGRQSEKIHDYTDAKLVQRLEEPRVKELQKWIDPYSYREQYTMPKLILLGTNDRYWTVDSLRHYWRDLPAPKVLYQTPNAGHDLNGGKDALHTLAAFYELIASGQPMPQFAWQFTADRNGAIQARVDLDPSAGAPRLWRAESKDRDFRDENWKSHPLEIHSGTRHVEAVIEEPAVGHVAFLVEAEFKSPSGHLYKLSTEAKVAPDSRTVESAD